MGNCCCRFDSQPSTVRTPQPTFQPVSRQPTTGPQSADVSKAKSETEPQQPTLPAPAPPSNSGFRAEQLRKFQEEALSAHNSMREMHRAGHDGYFDLTLSDDLCVEAQRWAEHMARKNDAEKYSNTRYNGELVGESLAKNHKEDYSGKDVTDNWYKECTDYRDEEDSEETRDFTQMVWKSTNEFGIGKARKDGNVYICAMYYPAGNILGNYQENVNCPKKD